MRLPTQAATALVLIGLSSISNAFPTENDRESYLLHQYDGRDAASLLSLVNGSWFMLPKCDVLDCGPPAETSDPSNNTLRKRAVDREVDEVFDEPNEATRYLAYIRERNVFFLVLRSFENRPGGPFCIFLNAPLGTDIRNARFQRLPQEEFRGLEAVDYVIPPFVVREFGRVHAGATNLPINVGRLQDFANLEQAMGNDNLNIDPSPGLVNVIQSSANQFGSDISLHRNRQRGFAHEDIDFDRLGHVEINRLAILERNPRYITRVLRPAITRIGDVLNALYPRSSPFIGQAFAVYANSVSRGWGNQLVVESDRRRPPGEPSIFEDALDNPQGNAPPPPPANNPPNAAPAPPSNNPPNLPDGVYDDPGLGDWGLPVFDPNGNQENLDTETELIRRAWFSQIGGSSGL